MIAEALRRAYPTKARTLASEETNLPQTKFPEKYASMPEQILSEDFLPEG